MRGDSCAAGSRDSNYIAIISDINEAYNIARLYYSRATFSGRLYRYRIRADNSFYSLSPSVAYIESRGIQFGHFERVMMWLQSEYAYVNSIPIENIQEAVELVYDGNTSMVNIVGVDYEKEIKGFDSCSCLIIQCLLCRHG
ncbi:pertussis toxin subunit [Salmonella enterica]|nr:pertussis toxin subunit [Salmonella enterica]EIL9695304.1 pertussis toxin subunit [Salmonella enterica]